MRATLDWLETEVAALRSSVAEHLPVIERLEAELHRARAHLLNLDNLIGIGHSELIQFAFPILHTLESITNRVGVTYLPALQRQGEGDRLVQGLVLCAAKAAGISWLTDLVVRLDGPHATYVAYPKLPIIYAPPRQATSLIDVPALYHELGHAVLEFDRTTGSGGVGRLLREAVRHHFAELARRGGPITPERRAARERRLLEAAAFWSEARLAEIFCDVLATVVCGPAHYISFLDVAFRDSRNPFGTQAMVHPPLAARVLACERTLTLLHQHEPIVVDLRAAWAVHQRQHPATHDFDLACSTALIDALVAAALQGIEAALPACRRYSLPLPEAGQLDLTPDITLEELVNHAMAFLYLDPGRYAAWERRAMAQCRQLADAAPFASHS